MLSLLIDTSTWLDLAKRRDGQKWIGALRELVSVSEVTLLVPAVVIPEFERNRPKVEASITTSISDRLKALRREVTPFGDEHRRALDELSHNVPLIGAMTTRNFDDVEKLLRAAELREPTDSERQGAVQRALDKTAPFHRSKNSIADALIIESYASALEEADRDSNPHAFVTTNSDDFSTSNGDQRIPHPDLAGLFDKPGSTYGLGVDGLDGILIDHFGDDWMQELYDDFDFQEDPRRLDEILEAEQEYFDRVWYHRSLMHDYRLEDDGDIQGLAEHQKVAGPGRARVEAKFAGQDKLGPYTDFELGMLNGKLSTLRWVLGSEWDFLDT